MEQNLIQRARERVLQSKHWGLTCVKAIKDGYWDEGNLIQLAAHEILAEDMRKLKEQPE